MKRVVGLAVFGSGYGAYLPTGVRAYLTLFPKYELRVHHDGGVNATGYGRTLRVLDDRGVLRLVQMPSRPGQGKCEKMLWRLSPAWDPEVKYVFSRDLDALPTWRERCATEQFVASGLECGTLLDNVAHAGVMGGLCGFRAETLREMFSSFEKFVAYARFSDERWAQHGADQDYLNAKIAPHLTVLEHATVRSRPTMTATKFITDIVPFEDPNVSAEVAAASNALVPYMGAAGYDRAAALAFYDQHCPLISEIRYAERAAGESP